MKLRCVFVLTIAAAISSAGAATLREQLALAEKDEDTYAQIELIQRILEKEPKDTALREALADWWLAIDDYDMAEKTVKEWKDAPEFVRAAVLASVLYHRDEKTDEAIQMLEAYHAKEPNDLEITRQLADYLSGTGNHQRLVTMLDAAPGLDADLFVTRAIGKRTLYDWDGALRDFALAEKANKEELAVRTNRAGFEQVQASLGGIKANTNLLAKEPGSFAGLLSRAYWYNYNGFATKLALADAEAALKIDPNSAAAKLIYAKIAYAAGKLNTADALQKYGVNINKDLPDTKALNALVIADLALAAKPGDTATLLGRSYALNDAPAQYEMGLRDADALLAIDPNNGAAQVEKIYSLVKLSRNDAAVAELQVLEKMKPEKTQLATASNYLADAAFTASKFDLALEFSDRAIAMAPTVAAYYKQRAAILQRLNRAADASAALKKADQLEKKAAR